MTAWHRDLMVAWDLESTGPHPDTARIVTATIIECRPDGIGNTYEWLVDPGIDIPAGATAVHGVTTEHARTHGVQPGQALAEIISTLDAYLSRGVPVVAFNASYDGTVLDREARRHNRTMVNLMPVVDSHVIDKHVDPYRRGKRTLTATCSHYGVTLTDAHTSAADALAAARLAFVLAQRYPEQLKIPLPDLHAAQRDWRYDQAASLQVYFRRHGKPDVIVNGEWPIQTLPAGWTPEQVVEPEQEVAS
jgi:DNA polymerase-3 subunit epsilon